MKEEKIIKKVALLALIFLILGIINNKYNIVIFPQGENIEDFEFKMITIATVLTGFSFTVMGMLFGFSSNELVKKLEDTDYMKKNIESIVNIISFFIVSIIFAFCLIFGISNTILNKGLSILFKRDINVNCALAFCNVAFVITGFIYFIKELKELSILLEFIYRRKKRNLKVTRNEFKNELEKSKQRNSRDIGDN